jgi:hypothetical protein
MTGFCDPALVAEFVSSIVEAFWSDAQEPAEMAARFSRLQSYLGQFEDGAANAIEEARERLFDRYEQWDVGLRDRIFTELLPRARARAREELAIAAPADGPALDRGDAGAIRWQAPLPVDVAQGLLQLDADAGPRIARFLAGLSPEMISRFLTYKILPPTGALLVGPAGTGKSTTARYIASMLGKELAVIRFQKLMSSYVAQSPKNLLAVMEEVIKRDAVLFLDELDALVLRRNARGNDALSDMKMQMMSALIDELDHAPPSLIKLGATNLPERLDDALVRRMSFSIVYKMPDTKTRRALVDEVLETVGPGATEDIRTLLVDRSDGHSGDFVKRLAHGAAVEALLRAAPPVLTEIDVRMTHGALVQAERLVQLITDL